VVLSAAASGVSRTKDTGTPMYMAPEVVHTSTYDEKVDIYSSAVTFYELFEEQLFDANTRFARGLTPSRIAVLIKQMGDADPTCRRASVRRALQPNSLPTCNSFLLLAEACCARSPLEMYSLRPGAHR
jgi:serine/threonine protein kinase